MAEENQIDFKNSEPWGWYIVFGCATVAGYLIFRDLMRLFYEPMYYEGWIGAILGLGIMITAKIIDRRYFGNRWGQVMSNKRWLNW